MPSDRKLTRQLVVRVDERTYGALVEESECAGRTVAQTVRYFLRHGVDGVLCARCGHLLAGLGLEGDDAD